MDNLMDFRIDPEELDRIASLSRIYRPDQLKRKALTHLKVLLFQHDCLLVQAIHALDQGEETMDLVMAVVADRRQLDIAARLIASIDTNYQPAPKDCVDSLVELCKRDAGFTADTDKRMNELKSKLEALFKKSEDLSDD